MAKKVEVVKKHTVEEEAVEYVIPQIPEDIVGLREFKPGFEKTLAVSPMAGTYTKDVLTIPDVDVKQDIDLAYDKFRVEPKLTEQDEIERFGIRYPEFPSVDAEYDASSFVKPQEQTREKPSGIGLNFGVISTAEELVNPIRIQTPIETPVTPQVSDITPNPHIHFGEVSKPVETNISFEQINISNEIKAEQEESIVKPIGRVPDFMKVNVAPKVDESIPKTIVYVSKPVTTESTPTINIPPFMTGSATVLNNDTEIIFDTGEVNSEPEKDIYETYRTPVESQEREVIYEDKYHNYKYPPFYLLNPVNEMVKEEPEWIHTKREIINRTLQEFGIDGEVVKYTYGPSVTRYEVKLNSGVNVKKISSIEDNIKMNLSAKTIRIEAPIPGKSNVGIEVPNDEIRTVNFAEVVDVDSFIHSTTPLNIALGLNIDGKPVHTTITKMPHGLIAGGTGSGKSVCVNGVLISLLLKHSPAELKLILVDPKQVELIAYQDLPHLATPVITDPKMASEALKWACVEMEKRYRAFSAIRAKNIEGFNERVINDPSVKKLPYLVIVIEELADLMMTCGNDVEASIQRITQMGRAAGIHLIIATQRPTTDIVKGTIKANIPCRIAFRVSQFVDSTTILDGSGAENLLGRGDMLFKTEDLPIRVQGAFLQDLEIAKICDYIRDNYGPDYIFTHEDLQNNVKQQYGATNGKDGEDMALVYDVALFVIERGTCSINTIQPAFNLGFRRAQRIVEILEEMGVVGPNKGTTGRPILMTNDEVKKAFKVGE